MPVDLRRPKEVLGYRRIPVGLAGHVPIAVYFNYAVPTRLASHFEVPGLELFSFSHSPYETLLTIIFVRLNRIAPSWWPNLLRPSRPSILFCNWRFYGLLPDRPENQRPAVVLWKTFTNSFLLSGLATLTGLFPAAYDRSLKLQLEKTHVSAAITRNSDLLKGEPRIVNDRLFQLASKIPAEVLSEFREWVSHRTVALAPVKRGYMWQDIELDFQQASCRWLDVESLPVPVDVEGARRLPSFLYEGATVELKFFRRFTRER